MNTFLTEAQGKGLSKIFLTKDDDCFSKLSPGTMEICWFTPGDMEEGKESI